MFCHNFGDVLHLNRLILLFCLGRLHHREAEGAGGRKLLRAGVLQLIEADHVDTLGLAAIIYTYFRIFSRNIQQRYAENQKFLQMTSKFRFRFNKEKDLMKQRKTHHIYSCPGCGQKIRIPKGKGKIEIECPKCHTKFVKRS